MEHDSIEISLLITAPFAKVWSCLTEPDTIKQWWSSKVYLEPYLGGQFEETWENDQGQTVVTRGKILLIHSPHKLIISWADEDWENETEVSFSLLPYKDKTRLTLVHKGWEKFPNDVNVTLQNHHQEGWLEILQSLKDLAEATTIH